MIQQFHSLEYIQENWRHLSTQMSRAVLLIKQLKKKKKETTQFSSIDDWINKM